MIGSRRLLLLILLVSCVSCDQITKGLVRTHFSDTPAQSWLYDVVRFHYAENAGAFLSLGTTLPEPLRFLLFQVAVGGMLAGLFLFTLRGRFTSRWFVVGLGLILAGGIGNFLDRLLHQGLVLDFMNMGIGPVRTGIFNVADVCITVGALLLAWLSLKPSQASKV